MKKKVKYNFQKTYYSKAETKSLFDEDYRIKTVSVNGSSFCIELNKEIHPFESTFIHEIVDHNFKGSILSCLFYDRDNGDRRVY